jgi:two-component system uhpT operon response regulator UhpA
MLTVVSGGAATTVSVVDDHWAVGAGVLASLRDHRFRAGTAATTVDELLAAEPAHDRSQVVLMDLALGDGSIATDNIARLRAAGYTVIVYTSETRPERLSYLLGHGVSGVVGKSDDERVLVDALSAVARGDGTYLSPLMAQIAIIAPQRPHLAPREIQVLRRFALGASAVQIAHELTMTENTVRSYLKQIRRAYDDLGEPLPSRTDLLRAAVRDGFVEDTPW